MADGTFGTEARYRTIVVCGGGCYGGYYVRQLARAHTAGALAFDRVCVVDRDPGCRVKALADAIRAGDDAAIIASAWQDPAQPRTVSEGDRRAYRSLPLDVVTDDWHHFFDRWFGDAITERAATSAERDAVVPSPLMPHLLADWVESRLRAHRPLDHVTRQALSAPLDVPWQRNGERHALYASFATWMCPINCIEPFRCPETRGPRDWSLPVTIRRVSAAWDVVAMFHTTHRAHGVGMFDVSAAMDAEHAIAALAGRPAIRILVGSASHCHGAFAELVAVR